MGNAQLISFGLSTLLQSTRTQNMWLKCWHLCLWFSFLARISDLRDLQEARLSVSSRFPQIFPSLIAGSQIPIFWLPPPWGCYSHSWTITSGHLMAHYDFSLLATQPSCSLSPALASPWGLSLAYLSSSLIQSRVLSQCSGSLPKWTLLHTGLGTSYGKNSINKIIPSCLNISDEHWLAYPIHLIKTQLLFAFIGPFSMFKWSSVSLRYKFPT